MALTKVIGNGLGTLGDGTANDTKIVFDGNAQDFHIGLDDSSDSLTIGLGSALGTTSHMVIDANGHVTKPLQPAFLVRPVQQNNVATDDVINFGTEVFDQNGDFASNTFTAPVTGKYNLTVSIRADSIDNAATYSRIFMDTSNRAYYSIFDVDGMSNDPSYWTLIVTVLADMDANDTVSIKWSQNGGSNQADILTDSYFSGYLVC